jgi:hypothetical protein
VENGTQQNARRPDGPGLHETGTPHWAADELTRLGATSEIHIATLRTDGTARSSLPIWVVRVGDELFVRSYHGVGGSWFRRVTAHPFARIRGAGRDFVVRLVPADGALRDDVDRAYWAKYGRRGYGAAMTTPEAAASTMRLEPANSA